MKIYPLVFVLLMLTTISQAQEMETRIFNVEDIHLNLTGDSTSGSAEINLARFGDFNDALVNFKYWEEPYTFVEGQMFPVSGGFAKWSLGVDGGFYRDGDFTISNEQVITDAVFFRRDFTIREDNGFVGIGTIGRPLSRLHVDHLSNIPNEPSTPALLVGPSMNIPAYANFHKPKFDTNRGIAIFAENSNATVGIYGSADYCQLAVWGRACAQSWFTLPIIVAFEMDKYINVSSILDDIKVDPGIKIEMEGFQGLGLDLESLKNISPTLVKEIPSLDPEKEGAVDLVMDYNAFIPMLVAAHQDKSAELTTAKEEIELLKARLDQLEKLLK